MSMEMQIATFLEAQSAELAAATNTQLAYARDLRDFADWLRAEDRDFAGATREMIETYLISLADRGLSVATRARRLSAIRQYYRFAFEEGWRADNPAIQIKGPGRARRLPKTLDVAEVERLIAAAEEIGRKPEDRLRNQCLMELLYATGMRVTELVSLPVAAARGRPRMLLVSGKGGKERLVPLSAPARETLARWLEARDRLEEIRTANSAPASRYLFPSRGKSGHLTRHWFFTLIKDLAVRAGIDPALVTPHTLRHAFATHLLANGADLMSIQALLGHADVGTTEIYTHVLDANLTELVLSHHPLARKPGPART
ncbi:integrase/recombinase XerD [Palleronia aestuarii]|uniref:Tyrosine recombinase XerC n=1 Tax=Palleronia aestuarii TaxID=568105 RepID=A0A2W7NHH8_9RHOB|nr:site-specific tyrosine recombinase XerD [Palleronia aestuarii]PZX19891.1 integrase/recombinase XerD [Palleronia aestuarii]